MLEVNGLCKRFGGFLAVNQVSFEVRAGEILGLIGPNGSGKSTTFNLIAGTLRPSSGSIRLDGKEIAGLPPHAICHAGSAAPSRFRGRSANCRCWRTCTLGAYYGEAGKISRSEAERRAAEALDMVGLPSDPPRHHQRTGRGRAEEARARARARNQAAPACSPIESLGGLDRAEMERAADLLGDIRSRIGITIIWVEHIMGVLMRVVDRVIVLDHGEKIFEGKPSEAAVDCAGDRGLSREAQAVACSSRSRPSTPATDRSRRCSACR